MAPMISAATRRRRSARGSARVGTRDSSRVRARPGGEQRFDGRRSDAAAGVRDLLAAGRLRVQPKRAQILERQVERPAREIAGTSRRMLVSCSATPSSIGVAPRAGIAIAEDLDAHQADGRRHADAVLVQLRERRVAAWMQIHLDAVDQRVERRARKVEPIDERLQRAPLRRLRRLVRRSSAPAPPPARQLSGCRARPPSPTASSTASSTARQKSQTAMIARRLSGGRTRNE